MTAAFHPIFLQIKCSYILAEGTSLSNIYFTHFAQITKYGRTQPGKSPPARLWDIHGLVLCPCHATRHFSTPRNFPQHYSLLTLWEHCCSWDFLFLSSLSFSLSRISIHTRTLQRDCVNRAYDCTKHKQNQQQIHPKVSEAK